MFLVAKQRINDCLLLSRPNLNSKDFEIFDGGFFSNVCKGAMSIITEGPILMGGRGFSPTLPGFESVRIIQKKNPNEKNQKLF